MLLVQGKNDFSVMFSCRYQNYLQCTGNTIPPTNLAGKTAPNSGLALPPTSTMTVDRTANLSPRGGTGHVSRCCGTLCPGRRSPACTVRTSSGTPTVTASARLVRGLHFPKCQPILLFRSGGRLVHFRAWRTPRRKKMATGKRFPCFELTFEFINDNYT